VLPRSWAVVGAIGLASSVLFAGPRSASRGLPLGLDLYRPVPDDNPLTTEKIALGRRLFHDRRLSAGQTLSCAGCHDAARAFTSARAGASLMRGRVVSRDVPTLVNRAWGRSFFWDGRAATLEEQALQPILNPYELGLTRERIVAVARSAAYRSRFFAIFGVDPTADHVAQALAAYVRTIVAGNSPYDRFKGGDRSALSGPARDGLVLFTGKAGCSGCHAGPNFTDEQFHNTGIAWRTGPPADEGRAFLTGRPEDRGAFKTPTLRQVTLTAPYMHDGSIPTIDLVIEYYNRGGQQNPALDTRLHPLHLSVGERRDLAAFLSALTGEIHEGAPAR
jgi:cytochrome c peroxidase